MSDSITQWLTEIRTLQRQLADLQKERDQALASAANWRRLYETEAEQRRLATMNLPQPPEAAPPLAHQPAHQSSLPDAAESSPAIAAESADQAVLTITSVPELQAQLQEMIRRCQTLQQRLTDEKAAHAQTRHTLTTALGDAFDSFKGSDPRPSNAKSLAKSPQQS